jgi:hypothetical protein
LVQNGVGLRAKISDAVGLPVPAQHARHRVGVPNVVAIIHF